METTTSASSRAEQDEELVHATSSSDTAKGQRTLSGFRKMREALMAAKFQNYDNVPVAVSAVPGLFIGSYGAAMNLTALTRAQITHILCVSPSLPLKQVFTYLQLKVADQSSVTISDWFDEALDFIDSALSAGGKVLVHCFMGRSRSATIVAAFLIARQGCSLSQALGELRRVRPQVQPNSGFYQELRSFEAKHKQK